MSDSDGPNGTGLYETAITPDEYFDLVDRLDELERRTTRRLMVIVRALRREGIEMADVKSDVAALTQAESDAEARVSAEVANLQAEIAAAKSNGVSADALAGIEAVTARLQALAQPAAASTPAAPAAPAAPTPVDPTPAPAPAPVPAAPAAPTAPTPPAGS